MACVLGLDIGTTSTIGILIRLPNTVLGLASRPVTLHAPEPGWAEEDPEQWWSNVQAIVRELLATSGIAAAELAAVGVTGMLPAVVLLDADGTLIRPSIQQSDGRCGREVAELAAEIPEAEFLTRAGNGINQQLVTAKLRWLRRHEPAAFARIRLGDWLLRFVNWRLTGERAVEQNWALEAGFTDIRHGTIADDLVALAGIPRSAVPRRVVSHDILGRVSPEAAAATGLPAGIPVIGGAADHIASAYAAGVVAPGDVLLKFRRLRRRADRDRPRRAGSAHVSRLSPRPRPLRAERLHVDRRLRPQLVRRHLRRRRARSRRRDRAPAARSARRGHLARVRGCPGSALLPRREDAHP